MCATLGMLFVLVMFKSVLHTVLCVRYGGVVMYHGVREEWLLRREGGGYCRRADHGMGSGCVGLADLPYMYSKGKNTQPYKLKNLSLEIMKNG